MNLEAHKTHHKGEFNLNEILNKLSDGPNGDHNRVLLAEALNQLLSLLNELQNQQNDSKEKSKEGSKPQASNSPAANPALGAGK